LYGGLPWMQAVFYGVGAAVIGIIAVGSYKLTAKSTGKDRLLWIIFIVVAVTTFITEREIIWLILLGGFAVWFTRAPPKWLTTSANGIISPILLHLQPLATESKLIDIAWFFTKAGAFVFGSGLAIVPFLYGGVVKEFQWLNEQQFLDAVAVAMVTPGPVVITVGFIGYLVAGPWGAVVAALATFVPCYLFTVIPAPYFKKYGRHPAIKAFVNGVTAAAIGAIAGAVLVLGKRTLTDIPAAMIALATVTVLWRYKKVQEPFIIVVAALIGIAIRFFTDTVHVSYREILNF
jgi:chromate transporter